MKENETESSSSACLNGIRLPNGRGSEKWTATGWSQLLFTHGIMFRLSTTKSVFESLLAFSTDDAEWMNFRSVLLPRQKDG